MTDREWRGSALRAGVNSSMEGQVMQREEQSGTAVEDFKGDGELWDPWEGSQVGGGEGWGPHQQEEKRGVQTYSRAGFCAEERMTLFSCWEQ